MFKQSIDPKGGFPPRNTKKTDTKKKGKKTPKIKRRKRTKDRFAGERKAEDIFRFGERRSGLSGRTLFKPSGERQPRQPPPSRRTNYNSGNFIRIHNESIQNKLREDAEKKLTGGTFTGTSIGEEKRVAEAAEVDKLFKIQEARDRSRIVGALEKFVKAENKELTKETIRLPDRLTQTEKDKESIRQTITDNFFDLDEPLAEQKQEIGLVELKEIGTQTGSLSDRRPPEEDINFLSANRSKRSPTPFGTTPPRPRPRPNLINPSLTKSIPTQSTLDRRTPEQRRKDFIDDDDTTEFLTPTGKIKDIIKLNKSTEVPPIPLPLSSGTEQITADELVKRAKKAKAEADKDLEQDTSSDEEVDFEEVAKRPEAVIKTEARLEAYQELANFSKKQENFPKDFDNVQQHYRLVILDDIKKSNLGGNQGATDIQFKKGDQFRMKNTSFKGQEGANQGFKFYKDKEGKQLTPNQDNLMKFNFAKPKADLAFREAITQGKIKIVFDDFEDEI